MYKKLKETIISEIQKLDIETSEENSKKIQDKLSNSNNILNTVKYKHDNGNKFKVFFFDFINHGVVNYSFKFFLKNIFFILILVLLYNIACSLFSDFFVKGNPFLGGIMLASIFGLMVLSACSLVDAFFEIPSKTIEYINIDKIQRRKIKNEESLKNTIVFNEKIFNEGNSFNYKKVPISKITLDEAIKSLSEDNIKELLKAGEKKCIYYTDLIKMIKDIEYEIDISEIYEKMKKNS